MKTMLFLDDWLLDRKRDVVRRFPSALQVALNSRTSKDMARCSVLYDLKARKYRALGKKLGSRQAMQWESTDGVTWRRNKFSMRVHKTQNFPFEQTWFYDRWDKNPQRRFKMMAYPYEQGNNGGPGILAFSPDGNKWTLHPECEWLSDEFRGSDTTNVLYFNPIQSEWILICRKYHADRRIALVRSKDLIHWTKPEVVLHPDSADPDLFQFYGMSAINYENDYFIGIIQGYQPPVELSGRISGERVKMDGSVTPQLAYSYDGLHWLRSNRSAVIQRNRPGEVGAGCIYPHSIIQRPDGGLNLYSLGASRDHGMHGQPGYTEGMLLHQLRADGFAFLEPIGGMGQITTRVVVPRSGALRLNFEAPAGEVRVQLTARNGECLKGFSFEDCVPLRGDARRKKVTWKGSGSVKSVLGKPLRIEINMNDARLYALHWDVGLWYTGTREPVDRF